MVAKKAAAKKTAAKKAAEKKAAADRTAAAAEPAATAEPEAKAAPAAGKPARKTGARTVVAKKTPGGAPAAARKVPAASSAPPVPKARASAAAGPGEPAEPGELAVRRGEEPWSPEEVEHARTGLRGEAVRLRNEISSSEAAITGLMRDSGDGAGDDQVDTGTKNITREHEMALNANAREMLEQTDRALERIDAGTYGLCESCGNPIGKARMQAFPRATLCVECKQKQERR